MTDTATDSAAGTADFIGTKLLLIRGDSLLTCLRDDFDHIPFPNHWDLPGGGREGHETPLQCGLRELYEEFGLILPPERVVAHRFPSWSRPDRVSWLLAGRITRAEIAAIRFGDEGQEWRMMPVADYLAHPRAVPHFKDRIGAVVGRLTASAGQHPL